MLPLGKIEEGDLSGSAETRGEIPREEGLDDTDEGLETEP